MTIVLTSALLLSLAAPQAPPAPTPGPEHKLLAADAGTWDAVVEMQTEPGKPPTKAKGVEVSVVGCGGLCLITDFKGEMMGTPFHGHGVVTWDPAKKKYTGVWTDSMSFGISTMESTHDATTKRWTGTAEGPDASGKMTKSRSVTEMPNPNTRVFTMYATGPDGKEAEQMKITYTRRRK